MARPIAHGRTMAWPWTCASCRGKHLTKKRTLGKEIPKLVVRAFFLIIFMDIQKARDVRTIIFVAEARRDLCYVSENTGFCFTLFETRK